VPLIKIKRIYTESSLPHDDVVGGRLIFMEILPFLMHEIQLKNGNFGLQMR